MYKLEIGSRAKKDIRKLGKSVTPRIIQAIQKLKKNPRPPGSKKLSGSENTGESVLEIIGYSIR